MTIEELNRAVDSGEIDELIRVSEARQQKELSKIADAVCGREKARFVLLAGPSSAGKTTTSKRLCTQLRVNDRAAIQLSTDDYFVGDARNPRDEEGNLDYETVECVDMKRLALDVNRLMAGETIHPRRFDFARHEGYDSEETLSLPAGGYIVLEGTHALNPRLTADIPDESKFRIFIEPKTQLTVFALTKLDSRDGRLLRRLVRDNQFRKMSPFDTFDLWPKVLAGEEKWINPFRSNADAEFDSGLIYELSVLRRYVAGLLEKVCRKRPDTVKAKMLMELVQLIHPASPNAVPGDSILRETIGGSQLEY